MNEYVIFTDTGCDIDPTTLENWGVKFASLTFKFDDSDVEYTSFEFPSKEFYDSMRSGRTARTSAVNIEIFKEEFEKELKKGNDILYLGLSSGISTTFNSGRVAAEELSAEYPDNKIIAVDTLAASAGEGLLLYFAVEEKKKGASIEEVANLIKELAPKMCHWFTVEDLKYLKRGGRISPTAALVGNALGIKPVLHVDDNGKLVNVSKIRGRKATLKALADKYTELAEDPENGVVYVCHADCIDDVKQVEEMIYEKHGVKFSYVADISPSIGAHAGPGTIAVFFIGKER